MDHPYSHLESTACWKNIDRALADLIGNGDVALLTLPPYVIGYLCDQLSAAAEPDTDPMGEDQEEQPPFYWHSASLRISADALDFKEIAQSVGLQASYTHRMGDRRSPAAPPFKQDMWSYKVPVDRNAELDAHLSSLAEALLPSASYLRTLKEHCSVDVFATYTSNSHTAGFMIGSRALRVFDEIGIDIGVSTVIV